MGGAGQGKSRRACFVFDLLFLFLSPPQLKPRFAPAPSTNQAPFFLAGCAPVQGGSVKACFVRLWGCGREDWGVVASGMRPARETRKKKRAAGCWGYFPHSSFLPSLSRPRRRALQGVGPPTPRPPRPHRGGGMRAARPPLATRSHGGRVEHSRKRRKNRRVGASALSPCLFLGARRRTRAVVFSRFTANQLELTHIRFAWLVVSAVCVPGPGGRRTSPSKDTTWHLCADLVWPCAPSSRAQYHNPSPKTARGHTGKVPRR